VSGREPFPCSVAEWDTWPARRRRTLVFLVFAAVYIAIDLVRSWVDYSLFGETGSLPCAFDRFFVWLGAPLLALANSAAIFFLLTRVRALTQRRWAFLLLLPGLIWIDYCFSIDYPTFWFFVGVHALFLALCALASGPEFRSTVVAFLDGPLRKTLIGKAARLCLRGAGQVAFPSVLTWLGAGPARPEWDTWEARRRRTLLFLIFAGVYIGGHLVVRWLEFPLFRDDDWYYFGPTPPSLFEHFYRWFLTFLPLAAWIGIVFFALTRASALTHRRYALFLVLVGMTYFEADMRWFQLSRKHVSFTEIKVFFTVDASMDLGLRSSDYESFFEYFALHAAALCLCALLTGPELKSVIVGIVNGPLSKSIPGKLARFFLNAVGFVVRRSGLDRFLARLDSEAVFAAIALLVFVDPVIIWALDQQDDNEESRSVIRDLADTNPFRWHSLDRGWDTVVFPFSERHQDLAAANAALRNFEPAGAETGKGGDLFIPKPAPPAKPYDVLLIQVESLNAQVFWNADLPFSREFAKKCLRLKRNFSVANSTHYGVLGYLHGNPATFFNGQRDTPFPCKYLDAFKAGGYSSRLLSMRIMSHHYLGQYIPKEDWTRPVFEAGSDWSAAYEAQRELERPGPHYLYLFYNCCHFPYRHQDKYAVYQPEAPHDFVYNRSDLRLYKDLILNRYKNSLLEFDDWLKHVLKKVDLTKTIVAVTGDHGEEIFDYGRLGHCSSLNLAQTMVPALLHVPGVEPRDVDFVTSTADILPSVADALGWRDKPQALGRSIFEPRSFRYAIVSNFEYAKALRWGVVTEGRKAILDRDTSNQLNLVSLVDWNGRILSYREGPQAWADNFRIIRQVEEELKGYGH
jgi:hypothetical protein